MMKHANCDHEATPFARAKCRKASGAVATKRVVTLDEVDEAISQLTAPKRVKHGQRVKLDSTYELIERAIDQRGGINVTVVTALTAVVVELTHINTVTVYGTTYDGDSFSANRRDIVNIRLS